MSKSFDLFKKSIEGIQAEQKRFYDIVNTTPPEKLTETLQAANLDMDKHREAFEQAMEGKSLDEFCTEMMVGIQKLTEGGE